MEQVQITAAILPENATVQTVMYESTGGQVLDDGVFFAAEPGVYVITAYAMDDSGVSGSITITVEAASVTGIAITGGSTVTVGKTLQLRAVVSPEYAADPSVTWSIVSGAEFATMDDNGLLTAIAIGKVTVQAAANDGSGVTATHKVEITPIRVSKITISGESTVKVGKTIQLSAEVSPDDAADKSVKWSISKGSSYAKISEDGVLTGIAAGKVTVKVTAQDGSGVSATFAVTVEEAGGTWEGSGTKKDPYQIACVEDLLNLKNVLNKSGYYFQQVADIDCSGVDWYAIGDYDHPFRHHIDGGGYTISNLTLRCEQEYDYYFGLFACAKNANFKNIHIVNAVLPKEELLYNDDPYYVMPCAGALVAHAEFCTFDSCSASVDFAGPAPGEGAAESGGIGGLVGSLRFGSDQTVLFNNCHTSGQLRGSYAGGLVGCVYPEEDYYYAGEEPDASVKNCSSSVEILEAPYGCVGGLIGKIKYLNVYNCHATGNVTSFGTFMGGLIGYAERTGEVAYCYATGEVRATCNYSYGYAHAGGLIGYMTSYVTVHDCYATGDIHSVATWSDCQDSSSKNGGIWVNYRNPCGSLIGTLYARGGPKYGYKINVYNCYATGSVYAEKICESEKTYCHGALVGFVYDDDTRLFMIDPSKDDQSDWAGFSDSSIGLFGNNYNLENLRTYYTPMDELVNRNWTREPVHDAMPTYTYVQIVDKTALKDKSTFTGWDFDNVWKMGRNGPELREKAKAKSVPEIPGPPITPAAAKNSFHKIAALDS